MPAIFILFNYNQDTESESYEIDIGVPQPNRPIKNFKGYMWQKCPYFTRCEKHTVFVLYFFCWSRAMFLLFCDHQETEYESCEIKMSISQPVFTHNNYIKGYVWQHYIYSTR